MACETPTPPAPMEDEIALDAPPVAMELAGADLADVEEGYFLGRKTGEEVEYVVSVSPDKAKLIAEDGDVAMTGDLLKVGETSEIRLRRKEEVAGTLNAAGPKPLIIVDGVIMSDPDALSNLSPAKIESVEVIKGAAAEALYGDRAAGGVIRVTTKR